MTHTLSAPATLASLGSPVAAAVILKNELSTLTASVKLIVILASRGALMPFLRGSVRNTAGPISTIGAVRRGFGVAAAKSASLLSLSVAPPLCRKMAVVLLGAGAFAVSAQVAPVP